MIDHDFRLLDPMVMHDRTSHTSDVSSHQAAFRDDVMLAMEFA